MSPLEQAVAEKLLAQRSAEGAAALWKQMWDSYQAGGVGAVEALLGELLELPGDEGAVEK